MTLAGLAIAAALCLGALGCVGPTPAADAGAEDAAEILFDMSSVSEFIRQSEAGRNVSPFSLGWFVSSLLSDIAARDEELFHYFHRGGGLMSSYLQTTFQSHPDEEIATLDRMAQEGNPTLRQAARHALGSLLHIPNSRDPAEIQADERRLLILELSALKSLQQQARDEARPRRD